MSNERTILDYLEDRFIAQGNLGPEFYYPSHPNIAEAEAVFRIATLAKVMKCPLYLPHLSAWESLTASKRPPVFPQALTAPINGIRVVIPP